MRAVTSRERSASSVLPVGSVMRTAIVADTRCSSIVAAKFCASLVADPAMGLGKLTGAALVRPVTRQLATARNGHGTDAPAALAALPHIACELGVGLGHGCSVPYLRTSEAAAPMNAAVASFIAVCVFASSVWCSDAFAVTSVLVKVAPERTTIAAIMTSDCISTRNFR